MLNAFRHQRVSHPVGSGSVRPSLRAKRLSASEGLAGGYRPFDGYRVWVLKAFRHQKGVHGAARGRHYRQPLVLNAFRHQRVSHSGQAGAMPPTRSAKRLSAHPDLLHLLDIDQPLAVRERTYGHNANRGSNHETGTVGHLPSRWARFRPRRHLAAWTMAVLLVRTGAR